jgi:hypothetical protein
MLLPLIYIFSPSLPLYFAFAVPENGTSGILAAEVYAGYLYPRIARRIARETRPLSQFLHYRSCNSGSYKESVDIHSNTSCLTFTNCLISDAYVVAERRSTARESDDQRSKSFMPTAPSSFVHPCINSIVTRLRALMLRLGAERTREHS